MSRSYRRPYAAINGTASAKDDKRLAHRGVRRKQNVTLRICGDYENLLLPHRFECARNEIYCWARDGAQRDRSALRYSQDEATQRYYQKLLRK
jgi:hypothetical protein